MPKSTPVTISHTELDRNTRQTVDRVRRGETISGQAVAVFRKEGW